MYSNSTSGKLPNSGWTGRTNTLNLKENEPLGSNSKRGNAEFPDKSNIRQSSRAPNSGITSTRSTQPESVIETGNLKPPQSAHAVKSKINDQTSDQSRINPQGVPSGITPTEELREKVTDKEETKTKSLELSTLPKIDGEHADKSADENASQLKQSNLEKIQPEKEPLTLAAGGSTDLVSKFKGSGPDNALEAAASAVFTNPVYAQKFVASDNLLDLATTIFKDDLDNTLAQIETSYDILQDSLEIK